MQKKIYYRVSKLDHFLMAKSLSCSPVSHLVFYIRASCRVLASPLLCAKFCEVAHESGVHAAAATAHRPVTWGQRWCCLSYVCCVCSWCIPLRRDSSQNCMFIKFTILLPVYALKCHLQHLRILSSPFQSFIMFIMLTLLCTLICKKYVLNFSCSKYYIKTFKFAIGRA